MNYLKIYHDDLVNGPGVRVTVFLSGCDHGCKGCYNTRSWSPNNGSPFDETTYQTIATQLSKDYVHGLTLTGGDPLFAGNVDEVLALVQRVSKEFPDKTVWMWTGYTMEEVMSSIDIENNVWSNRREILKLCNGVVDGKFEQDKFEPDLCMRGSTNQRVWHQLGTGDFQDITGSQKLSWV